MAKNNGKSAKSGSASATKNSKSSSTGKSAKAQRSSASKRVESEKLVEYIGQAAGKERHIEATLAAHLVMTTRPAYHGRLEEHLRATKIRAEKLEGRMKEIGGSTRSIPAVGSAVMGEVKDAAKMVADRAVSLAKGPLDAMRDDHEAETLLEHARVEYSDACEQMGTYTVVRALAKAADDKKTGKLAKDFRDEHADMAEFVENLIPKLSTAVVKTEARGKAKSGSGSSGSGTGSGSRQTRNGAGAQRSRSGTKASSAGGRSSATKAQGASTAKTASSGSRSKTGSGSRAGGSRGSGSRAGGSGQRKTAAKS